MLVDRSTVPIALGDVLVTIGGTVEVPGEVVFVHPMHNISIIRYNPQDLPSQADGLVVEEVQFSTARLNVRPHIMMCDPVSRADRAKDC